MPYLLAVSLPLGVLIGNPLDIPPFSVVARAVGVILVLVVLLDLLSHLVLRHSPARELLVCLVVLYFIAYGYVHDGLLQHALAYRYTLPLWTVGFLILAIIVWISAMRTVLIPIALFLRYCLVSLVCVQVVWLAWIVVPEICKGGNRMGDPLVPETTSAEPVTGELPDIYYVILDAYGRDDVLRELYGYDNREFLQALESRGFFVGHGSRANYPFTKWSLASSFNMTYLSELGLDALTPARTLGEAVNHGEVVRVLKQHGYRTAAFSTGFTCTECTSFDRYVSSTLALNEFEDALFRVTPIAPISFFLTSWTMEGTRAKMPLALRIRRGRTMLKFEKLPDLAKANSGPTFVFAHICAPHQPFVFDADGNEIAPEDNFSKGSRFTIPSAKDRPTYIRCYRDQLRFVNKNVLEVVDRILAESSRPAIIILQADHGPASRLGDEDANETKLSERLSILYAVFAPSDMNLGFYESITPVNTFRLILDHVFHTKLGLLEDKCYFPKGHGSPEFVDVTDSVRRRPPDHD